MPMTLIEPICKKKKFMDIPSLGKLPNFSFHCSEVTAMKSLSISLSNIHDFFARTTIGRQNEKNKVKLIQL